MIDLNGSSKIVPFGKYKGQPIEALAQDKSYLDWLSAQDWFRERHNGLYTLIVNNFTESSETPEHNSLQVLFLDDAFCFSFVSVAASRWLNNLKQKPLVDAKKRIEASLERTRDDLKRQIERIKRDGSIHRYHQNEYDQTTKLEGDLVRALVTSMPEALSYDVKFEKQFEVKGVDVVLECKMTSNEQIPEAYNPNRKEKIRDQETFHVEIKPAVGDDYPAVLRQMKANQSKYLFTQKFTGVGATKEQFVETMKLSGIKVIFRDELAL